MGTWENMEGNDEGIHRHVVGGLDAPFLSGPQGTAPRSYIGSEASDGIDDVLHDEPREQEEGSSKEISMIVFRDGRVWEAEAVIDTDDEGSLDWWSTAIAALDTSVDIAVADL